ncbi:NKG2-D type II integral membrane protein, partial [Ophiophagus hannah]
MPRMCGMGERIGTGRSKSLRGAADLGLDQQGGDTRDFPKPNSTRPSKSPLAVSPKTSRKVILFHQTRKKTGAFQRRQYKEAFDKSVDSQETSNGTEIKHRLENVVSRLQTFLCKQVPVNSTESFRCHLCPGNWSYHDGKCYWISKEPGTWDKSQEDCRARGAQMLVLKEQEEMNLPSIVELGEGQVTGLQELGPLLGDSCGMLIGPKIVAETCSTVSMWVCQAEALDINTPLA